MKKDRREIDFYMENQGIGAILLVIIAAIVSVITFVGTEVLKQHKQRIKKEEERLEKIRRDARQREELKRKKESLTEEYCDIMEEIAECHAEEPYRDFFLKYAPFYQRVIGLKRQAEQEGMTAELFTDSILTEAQNTSIKCVLDKNGFLVRADVQKPNKEDLKAKCQSLAISKLEYQIRQEKSYLEQMRQMLHYSEIIHETECLVIDIIQSAEKGDMKVCMDDIQRIEEILKQKGCCILFADSPEVKESEGLRVDFSDDAPKATELPGFYTFSKSKEKFYLMGTCTGTRRGS